MTMVHLFVIVNVAIDIGVVIFVWFLCKKQSQLLAEYFDLSSLYGTLQKKYMAVAERKDELELREKMR